MPVVIGIDPGPVTGLAVLEWGDVPLQWTVSQVAASSSGVLLARVRATLLDWQAGDSNVLVAAEDYVITNRTVRTAGRGAQKITNGLASWLSMEGAVMRSPGQVKPWASDERLRRAGVMDILQGMRHARDAARHALYAACHDRGLPDPLGRKFASLKK
jgi:hypothetical protein